MGMIHAYILRRTRESNMFTILEFLKVLGMLSIVLIIAMVIASYLIYLIVGEGKIYNIICKVSIVLIIIVTTGWMTYTVKQQYGEVNFRTFSQRGDKICNVVIAH